jgi:predicted enzyme related to lactoylglutathione lyase
VPDPLDILRLPALPADPDPAFANRLRARLARALALPEGVTVSDLLLDEPTAAPAQAIRHGDIGYTSLHVPDVEAATAFYSAVLGWQVAAGSLPASRQVEGLSLHAGLWGGQPHNTLFCAYAVEDAGAAVERIRAAGGTAGEPDDRPYGRLSDCVDDQGVAFAVYEPPGGTTDVGQAANGSRHGDLAYVTMEVVDSARARAFYGSVLGWRFEAGRVADGWQVAGVAPMTGLSGGHAKSTIVPMYRVDDVEDAVERVRAAGGTAAQIERHPYGLTSTCTDDQGFRFYLGQL